MILSDKEFKLFCDLIYDAAGITMNASKKALIAGRLSKRVKHFGLSTYTEYFKLIKGSAKQELQTAVDLLTTNETFFFREAKHFDFLQQRIIPAWRGGHKRVWSAASSSGEEAYTLAMTLGEFVRAASWEVVGTDISTQVLVKARLGQYPMARATDIPQSYLKKYCLKGVGPEDGTFMIDPKVKSKVSFQHANLMNNQNKLGSFDVIFLRNVLIYFNLETKQRVIDNILKQLKPGGFLMIGHSESLQGIRSDVRPIAPSIYGKPRD